MNTTNGPRWYESKGNVEDLLAWLEDRGLRPIDLNHFRSNPWHWEPEWLEMRHQLDTPPEGKSEEGLREYFATVTKMLADHGHLDAAAIAQAWFAYIEKAYLLGMTVQRCGSNIIDKVGGGRGCPL